MFDAWWVENYLSASDVLIYLSNLHSFDAGDY